MGICRVVIWMALAVGVRAPAPPTLDAFDTLDAMPGSTEFIRAVRASGTEAAVRQPGVTVFAPNDAAFQNLPAGMLQALHLDPPKLAEVIRGHIATTSSTTQAMATSAPGTLQTVGEPLAYDVKPGTNPAEILLRPGIADVETLASERDIQATNGLVTTILDVLLPLTTPAPTPAPTAAPTAVPTAAPTLAPPKTTIRAIIDTEPRLSRLSNILKLIPGPVTALQQLFESPGPATLFAPSNEAWDALGIGVKEYLNRNEASMVKCLEYGVVLGTAAAFGVELFTYEGSNRTFLSSEVDTRDIAASNGVVHILNVAKLPVTSGAPTQSLETLISRRTELSVFELLFASVVNLTDPGPYTLIAPSNSAWGALPQAQLAFLQGNATALTAVLSGLTLPVYKSVSDLVTPGTTETLSHKSAGKGAVVRLTSASPTTEWVPVTIGDVFATDGILHIVDKVLMPEEIDRISRPTVWDLVTENSELTEFVAFAVESGVDAILKNGTSEVTVLAPTNAAWRSYPKGFLAAVKESKSALTRILQCLVLTKALRSKELFLTSPVQTVDAATQFRFKIDPVDQTRVVLDWGAGVRLVERDLEGSNGVLHTIDAVVTPDPETIPEIRNQRTVMETIEPGRAKGVGHGSERFRAALEEFLARTSVPVPWTVFIPSQEAVDKVPWAQMDAALTERVLRQHIVPRYLTLGELQRTAPGVLVTFAAARAASVLAGSPISYTKDPSRQDTIWLNNQAKLQGEGTGATDGIVYTVDELLVPVGDEEALKAVELQDLGTVVASTPGVAWFAGVVAVSGVDLAPPGGAATVLAPSDAAMGTLPSGHRYHLQTDPRAARLFVQAHTIPGLSLESMRLPAFSPLTSAQNTNITAVKQGAAVALNAGVWVEAPADAVASNGKLHAVSGILPGLWQDELPGQTLYEVVKTDPALGQFSAAVEACGVPCTEVLQGKGPVTIFAKTDAGFEAPGDQAAARLAFDARTVDGYIVPRGLGAGVNEYQTRAAGISLTLSPSGSGQGNFVTLDPDEVAVSVNRRATNGVLHVLAPQFNQTQAPSRDLEDDNGGDGLPLWLILIIAGGLLLLVVFVVVCLRLAAKKGEKIDRVDAARREQAKKDKTPQHNPVDEWLEETNGKTPDENRDNVAAPSDRVVDLNGKGAMPDGSIVDPQYIGYKVIDVDGGSYSDSEDTPSFSPPDPAV